MNLGKVIVICAIVYLAFALPLHAVKDQAVQQCNKAYSEQGFDIVLSTEGFGPVECKCKSSLSRVEKTIETNFEQ